MAYGHFDRRLGNVARRRPQSGLIEYLVDAALLFDWERLQHRFASLLLSFDISATPLIDTCHTEFGRCVEAQEMRAANG